MNTDNAPPPLKSTSLISGLKDASAVPETAASATPGKEAPGVTTELARPPGAGVLYPLARLLDAWNSDAELAHDAYTSGIARGPITGIAHLDRELGGSLATGLHVLHGEPGTGKTALALQIAATCGVPALFMTTEMGPLELLRRITARITSTFLGRLRSGEFTPAASLALAERAVRACPLLALFDATRGHVAPWQADGEPAGILEAAETWRDHHQATSVLVVVDSLHTWADSAPRSYSMTEYENLNAAIGELRLLAARLGGPVLAIAERNRANMLSDGQSASAGTRRFEYAADTVLALQREGKEWGTDAALEYPVFVKLAKNRNGATGPKVRLAFHGALQNFREVRTGEL